MGFIAEEVAQVFPEAVAYEADGTTVQGVKYSKLVAVATEAIKAQHEKILDLQNQIDKFQDRLNEIEAEWKLSKSHIPTTLA